MLPKGEQQQYQIPQQLTAEKKELLEANKQQLKHLFKQANGNAVNNIHITLLKLGQAAASKKVNITKLSNKAKARLISQLIKYQGRTSLQEAFLRWKIRADPDVIKQAVEKIVLNSRLNAFNAFHKLKQTLGNQSKELRMNAKKKRNLSLINLALFIQKKEFQFKKQTIEQIRPQTSKMLGLLAWSISSKYRERYLREKFGWWRFIAKVKSEKLAKQLKTLEKLGEDYNMRNERLEKQRLKEVNYLSIQAFEKWRGDLMNFRLKKKFFGVLLKTTFGRLQRCYTRWVDLPDKRENDIKKQGVYLITKLSNKVDFHRRLVWNCFKEINDEAKNKKTKVIRELIEVTFNQSYTAFYKWANYNTYAKLTEVNLKKIKALQASANVTHQIVRNETHKLFDMRKKQLIVQNLDKIIIQIEKRQKQDAVRQILNYSIQKKMEEKLSNLNKQELISKLNEIANKTDSGLLRQVLKRFAISRQKQDLRKRFFGKLIMTTSGQVIESFHKWKSLPEPINHQLLREVAKLSGKLQLLFQSRTKQSFDPLKSLYYEAIQKKRVCIKQLMSVTMKAPQRYIKMWSVQTRAYKQIKACQHTHNFFESISQIMASNVQVIFLHDRNSELKKKCIAKLLSAYSNNLSLAFQKWRDVNKQQNILDQLGLEKKFLMIRMLNSFVEGGKQQNMRKILKIFYNKVQVNQKIKKIQMKLLSTFIGQVEQVFQKWKNLPGDSYEKAAQVSKFQASLGKVAYRFIKLNSWNKLESIYQDGQAKKKYYINYLLQHATGGLHSAFLIWHRRAWEMKIFEQFSQLNVSLNDQIVKQKLINWINAGSNVKNYALSEILRRFNKNAAEKNLRRKALSLIHRNTISQVWISFNKWKTLPESDSQQFQKASQFENSLLKFSLRILRKETWNPLQETYDDALAIKKRSVLLMIKTQESEQQRVLNQWNKNVQLMKEVQRCKCVIQLFQFVGDQVQHMIAPLKPDENSAKKEKTLIKLIQNNSNNLRYFLMKWYNDGKLEKLQNSINDEKKKLLLDALTKFLYHNDNSKLRHILAKFKNNSTIQAVQERFFARLYATKFGGVIVAFQKWKNLPEKKDYAEMKKGRKFEKALDIIFRNRVKISIDPFKELYQEANNKKLYCLRKLQMLTMGLNKRLFLQWRNTNRLQKSIESCKYTSNFFQTIALTLAGNVRSIFQTNKVQEAVLEKMIANTQNSLRWAFGRWINQSKADKIASQLDEEKKRYLLFALKRNLKSNEFGQLRDILRKFQAERNTKSLIKKCQLQLLHTVAGNVELSFQKWKSLQDRYLIKKASKFEQKLQLYMSHNTRNNSFKYLIDVHFEGQAKQKSVINKMIYNCMSAEKRMFQSWNKQTEIQKVQERSGKLFGLFNTIQKVQQSSIYFLFEDQIKEQYKQDELVRLLREWEEMFKDSYQKWKQTQAKLDLLANQQRSNNRFSAIEILKDYISNKKNYQLRMLLRHFSVQSEEHRKTNKYLLKIQSSTSGQLINSFQIWKRLPERSRAKDACIFEKKLFSLVRKPLLNSFNHIQDIYYQALNQKRRVILLLVKSKESQQQLTIRKWNNMVKQVQEQEKCKLLISVTNSLHQIVRENLEYLKPKSICEKKKLAIQLFYQHKLNQLNVAFVEWKNISYLNAHKQENQAEKEERLKREAIMLFQNYGIIRLRLYFTQWKIKAVKRNMIQVCNAIQKIIHLNRFTERAIKKYVLDIWRGPKKSNKWLRRVVEMIAKNSRLNNQVAFWRMRDGAISQKAIGMSTQKIIKCKKLFNNLNKVIDRVMQRAFTNIEHYGKGCGGNDTSSFQPSQSSFLQQTPIKDALFKSQIEPIIQINSQQLAFKTMSRIFNKQVKMIFVEFILQVSNSQSIDNQMIRASLNSFPYQILIQRRATERIFNSLQRYLKQRVQTCLYSLDFQKNQSTNDNSQQIIDEQQKQISILLQKLEQLKTQKLFKSLANCLDHFVEDAFMAIQGS